jgi:hypothetical protein
MEMVWHPVDSVEHGLLVLDKSPNVFVEFLFMRDGYGRNAVFCPEDDMV